MIEYGQAYSGYTRKSLPNTTAVISVPAKNAASVKESGRPANQSKGLKYLRFKDGHVVFEKSPGSTCFSPRDSM